MSGSGAAGPSLVTPPAGRGQQVLKNTVAQMGSKLGTVAIGIVMTPFALDTVGLQIYGLWTFVQSMILYVGVIDPGFGSIVNRTAAQHKVRGDHTRTVDMIVIAIAGYLVMAIVLSPAAIFGLPFLAKHLQATSSRQLRPAADALLCGYLFFFAASIAAIFNQALIGLGDLWLSSTLDIVARVTWAVVTVILLLLGAGIWGLILGSFSQVLVSGVGAWLACRRRLGTIAHVPRHIDRRTWREIASFGGAIQIAGIMNVATLETDPLVIGTAISVSDVGIYDVAAGLAQQVQFLPLSLVQAAMPAATDAFERGDRTFLNDLTVSSSRLCALLTFLAGGLVASVSPIAFETWLGHPYPHLELVFILLTISFSINNLTEIPFSVATAIGRPGLQARNAALGAGVNVVATVALGLPFGLTGVLIGTLLGVVVKTTRLIYRFYGVMGLSLGPDFYRWAWRVAVGTALPAVVVRVGITYLPHAWLDGRAVSILPLVAFSATYTVLSLLSLRAVGFFEAADAPLLARVVPGVGRKLVVTRFARWFLRDFWTPQHFANPRHHQRRGSPTGGSR